MPVFYKDSSDKWIYYGYSFVTQIELPEGNFTDDDIKFMFYREFRNEVLKKFDEIKFERKNNTCKAKFEFRFYNMKGDN